MFLFPNKSYSQAEASPTGERGGRVPLAHADFGVSHSCPNHWRLFGMWWRPFGKLSFAPTPRSLVNDGQASMGIWRLLADVPPTPKSVATPLLP